MGMGGQFGLISNMPVRFRNFAIITAAAAEVSFDYFSSFFIFSLFLFYSFLFFIFSIIYILYF